jgi:hypothetical protein
MIKHVTGNEEQDRSPLSQRPGPGWYADPAGRFTHRYWGPLGWTASVLREGRVLVDGEWTGGPGQFQQIQTELLEVEERLRAATAQHQQLLRQRSLLLGTGVPPGPPPAPPALSRRARVWRAESVRDLLLWLGSSLVAVAAVTFAALTWSHLGDVGRAGLLLTLTALVACGAAAAVRRLPATADVLGALAVALVLVDWLAASRSGLGAGHTTAVWWAWGTAGDAVLATVASRWLRTAKVAGALLAVAAGVLAVVSVTSAPWARGIGLAAVMAGATAVAAVLARRPAWRLAAIGLAVAGGVLGLAALAQLSPFHQAANAGQAAGPAAVLAFLAASPVVARALVRRLPGFWADVLVGLAVALLLGGGAALLSAQFAGGSLLAAVSVLAVAVVMASNVLPAPVRMGTLVAGAVAVAVSLIGLLGAVGVAMFGPWAWVQVPWSGGAGAEALRHIGPYATGFLSGFPAIIALVAAAVTSVALVRRLPTVIAAKWVAAGPALAAVAVIAVLPLVVGLTIAETVVVQVGLAAAAIVGAALLERSGRLEGAVLAGLVALVAIPAGGWALATASGTVACLAVLAASTFVAYRLATNLAWRGALAALGALAVIAEAVSVILAGGGSQGAAGLGLALSAGVVLAMATWSRPGTNVQAALETIGGIGLCVGLLIAGPDPVWRAGVLTVGAAALATAGARAGRRRFHWAAAAVAVAAVWGWLAAGHVTLLEAYTLPAAAAILVAGGVARRRSLIAGSWVAYGGGIALVLIPSLGAVVVSGGLARPLALIAGATFVVAVGARARLQAPLILGAATLLTLGANTIWPAAVTLPWATLGISGGLLLWIGITAERRLAQFRQLRGSYHKLA